MRNARKQREARRARTRQQNAQLEGDGALRDTIEAPSHESPDEPYDFAADDLAFDAARERSMGHGRSRD